VDILVIAAITEYFRSL
jgi:hypothetical protein